MIDVLIALALIVAAWAAGKKHVTNKRKDEYNDTKRRIDSVDRVSGDSVADRLRDHAKRR